MSATTRILLVEDDPASREYYSAVLRSEGYEVWAASCGNGGLREAREKQPHIMLLDVSLPGLDGMEVCRRIKGDAELAHIFVALFSGHPPDAAHKLYGTGTGADDYILKTENREEFKARVRTLVRLRETTLALHASEAHYRQLAENIREVFWMTNLEKTEMIYISPAYEEVWGRSCESLYASPRDWLEAIHPADRGRVLEAALTKQVSGHYDETYRILRPDGTVRWVQDRAFPVRDQSGKVYRMAGIAEDITARKRAEESLRESEARKTAVMEAALDGIITIDHTGRIIEFNSAAERTFGYGRAWVIGKRITSVVFPPSLWDWFQRGLDNSFGGAAEPVLDRRLETAAQHASGAEFPLELSIARIAHQVPPMFTVFVRDISERKHAEAQLAMLAQAVESTSEPICITDLRDRFIAVNPAFQRVYGYSESEILGKSPEILFSARNPPGLLAEIVQQTRSGGWRGEVWDKRKDGTELPVFLSTSQVKDTAGRVIGLMGVAQDITERKHAEEQIRLLADALQSTQELVCVTDSDNRFIFVNRAFLKAHGYSDQEVLGRKPDFLYSPKNPSGLYETVYRQTLAGGWQGEILNIRKNGTEFPVSLSTSQIKDGKGRILGLVGVSRDISERKRAEKQAAAFSELGHRLSAAATPEQAAESILNVASDLFGWDAGYVDLYARTTNEIVPVLSIDTWEGQRRTVPAFTLPLNPTPLMCSVMKDGARLINRPKEEVLGVDLVPFGDTKRRSASMMYVPIHSSGGILGILSIQSYTPEAYSTEDLRLLQSLADRCGDALQRIRMTEALRAAEANYRSIFENATEGIFRTTRDGHLLGANPALARMFGYHSPDEMLARVGDVGRQIYVVPQKRAELANALETQDSVQGFEVENYRKDGSKLWISLNGHAIRDAAGALLYYEGTIQDITERKQAQQRLADALELNLTILSVASVGIRVFRASGQCIFANAEAGRIAGASPEQLLLQNFRHIASWRKHGLLDLAEKALQTRKPQSAEFHFVTTFGKESWVDCHMAPFVSGAEPHLLMVNNEIMGRKRAEEALERSQRLQRAILDNISDPAWLKDTQGRFLACNGAMTRFFGRAPAQIIGKTVFELDPEEAARLTSEDQQVMQSRQPALFEASRTDPAKRLHWFESFKAPLFNDRGEVTGTVGIARDVTERKRAEQDLRELSRRVIEAQEAERMRVARELHDSVNQIIASAKMRLRKVEESATALGPAAAEILARCGQLLVRALEENRRIAHNLRPSDLDELGLATACRNFCNEVQSRTNLKVACSVARLSQRLPPAVELNLFRIVQEALNNIEKHARAKTAQVRLVVRDGSIMLKIKDDGCGFGSRRPRGAKNKGNGIGLTNMRERAAALGGTCEIQSAAGQGTTITVRLPNQGEAQK